MRTAWLALWICLLLALNGCALWDSLFGEEDLSPPELMAEGLEKFRDGKFEEATELFRKIRDQYPYSPYAIEAELKLADCLYERGLYEEAYEEYGEFERLHPRNPHIPYVIFRRGMCYFERASSIDRNQAETYKAKEEFERLISRFQKSDYTEQARRKLRECYVKLAQHELYVGDFYFKMGAYQAALNRYLYVIETYPDLGQYHQALEKIKQCKEKLALELGLPEDDPSWWDRVTGIFRSGDRKSASPSAKE